MYSSGMSAREDLVEATRELLWERGYGGTSPAAILAASGAGQGSMYHHFRGKEALALAAIERNVEEAHAETTADLATAGDAVDRLRAYLLQERDALKGCRFGRLAQDADVVGSESLRAAVGDLLAWTRAQLSEVVRTGVERGELRADLDPDRTAATLSATIQGAFVLARAAGDVGVYDDAVRGALDLLTAARA